MNREELKAKVHKRKVKKALRKYRFRPFKNFIFWFVGVLSSFAILAGTIFVGVKVLPIKTLLGQDSDKYVSEEVGDQSILDVFTNFTEYKFGDFPVVGDLLNEVISSAGFEKYVHIDVEELNKISIKEITDNDPTLMDKVMKFVKVTATLENTGVLDMLGDFDLSNISALGQWEEVQDEDITLDSEGNIAKDSEGNLLHTPAQYYYIPESNQSFAATPETNAADDDNYERAFEDDGTRIAPEDAQIYYANISVIPILDVVDLIDETIPRIKLLEVVNMLGITSEDESLVEGGKNIYQIIEAVLGDVTVDELMDIKIEEKLGNVYLSDILGEGTELSNMISSIVGDVTGKEYDEVTLSDFLSEDLDLNAIRISSVLKEENLSEPILEVIKSVLGEDDYNDITLGHVLELDYYSIKLSAVLPAEKIEGFTKAIESLCGGIAYEDITVEDLMALDIKAIKLSDFLPMENLDGAHSILGIVANILGVADYDDITLLDLVNLNIYNIKLSDIIAEDDLGADFRDMIIGIVGVDDYDDITVETILKVNISSIKLSDVWSEDKLSEDVANMLAGVAGVDSYDEITIDSLLNVNLDGIKLHMIIDRSRVGEDLINVILDVTGAATYEDVTLDMLLTLDVDDVKISSVLPESDISEDFKNLIIDGTGAADYNEITVSDVANLEFDSVKLIRAIPYSEDNKTLYSVLLDAKGIAWTDADIEDKASQLLLSDLNSFDTNAVRLSSVLSVDDSLEKVLLSATGAASYEEITFEQLGQIEVNDVAISAILDPTVGNNQDTLELICDAINQANVGTAGWVDVTVDTLKVGDIQDFDTQYIRLSKVLTTDNGKLEQILAAALDKDYVDITINDIKAFDINEVGLELVLDTTNDNLKNILTQATNKTSFSDVKVGDIASDFSVSRVELKTVLQTTNTTLKDVLSQATGIAFDSIKVSDLEGGAFDIGNVQLNTVIDEDTGNVIIDKLRSKGITVSEIGEEINKLSLYEVYGEDCFTKESAEAIVDSPIYQKVVSGTVITYELTDGSVAPSATNEMYYIHKNDGIWLLLCFTPSDTVAQGDPEASLHCGRPRVYTVSNASVESLQDHDGVNGITSLTAQVTNATVRQLLDAGVLSGSYDIKLYSMSLSQAILKLNELAGYIS